MLDRQIHSTSEITLIKSYPILEQLEQLSKEEKMYILGKSVYTQLENRNIKGLFKHICDRTCPSWRGTLRNQEIFFII